MSLRCFGWIPLVFLSCGGDLQDYTYAKECDTAANLCMQIALHWCVDERDAETVIDCIKRDTIECSVQFAHCRESTHENYFSNQPLGFKRE